MTTLLLISLMLIPSYGLIFSRYNRSMSWCILVQSILSISILMFKSMQIEVVLTVLIIIQIINLIFIIRFKESVIE